MQETVLPRVRVEISPRDVRRRLFEVIPGALSWSTLVGLTVLAFTVPFWVAVFIIAYDTYILTRAAYMSVHLVYAYRRLKRERLIDWVARCRGVSGDIRAYQRQLVEQLRQWPADTREQRQAGEELRNHLRNVNALVATRRSIMRWERVHHVVLLPTYNESLEVLTTSLEALSRVDFPRERMHVVVGFEERAGEAARARARALQRRFGTHFKTFLTTFHPDALPGEARVKSANARWAVRAAEAQLQELGVTVDQVLVSNFDSDTVVDPVYFSMLTYTFITHADRYRRSYQPLPLYNNNVWDAPAFSRVIATGSTFWQMIESTRPERLVTFSSHSMTLRALKDVGYWHTDRVSEDSRIFWQCLLHYNGDYRTEPLYATVSMDAALADTWWQTLLNQYKQKRRWAWGIENFPFLAEGFWQNRRIRLHTKALYLFRTLEGHYSWATAPIIVAGLGWLPILFGGAEFHSTFLSYSLPFMARTLMTVAMLGLVISGALTFLLLPTRPRGYGRWRYLTMALQWVLVPIISTVLSALPALDAETRLMLGRDLSFNVMEKARRRR